MTTRGPFHEGELAVQERTGERAMGARNGALLRDFLTPAACRFVAQQRTVAAALLDALGRPRATLWASEPGFVRCEHGRVVEIARSVTAGSIDDPTSAGLTPGAGIGLLAIDLGSRRRLRINGRIQSADDETLALEVHESFPNCPKYIQQRELIETASSRSAPEPVLAGALLGAEQRALVELADTAFVASLHPERGLDASHRGGAPGFIRALDERTLRFPDYPGNSMFQTLGNFEIDPRAGVVVVDFERGRLLSLTGDVKTFYGREHAAQPSGGSGRYWELAVQHWFSYPLSARLGWRLLEPSPFNPASARPATDDEL